MEGDFVLADLGRHVEKKQIAQMQVGVVDRVHHHAVVLAHEVVLYYMAAFYMVTFGKCHPAGLRGIVLRQLSRAVMYKYLDAEFSVAVY